MFNLKIINVDSNVKRIYEDKYFIEQTFIITDSTDFKIKLINNYTLITKTQQNYCHKIIRNNIRTN